MTCGKARLSCARHKEFLLGLFRERHRTGTKSDSVLTTSLSGEERLICD